MTIFAAPDWGASIFDDPVGLVATLACLLACTGFGLFLLGVALVYTVRLAWQRPKAPDEYVAGQIQRLSQEQCEGIRALARAGRTSDAIQEVGRLLAIPRRDAILVAGWLQ
jgi:hypothetical protein